MACGCGDRCTCSVVGGEGVTVTGSGDATDPFVVSSVETPFAATSTDDTINITPAGSAGHAPDLAVNISPNPGNALENAGNGLFVGPTALVNAVFPVGMSIEITHDQSLPSGFLDEDGDEYLVNDYPSLAAAYGATGVGDGLWDTHPQLGAPAAGNFRVPDSQTRAVYNKGTGFAVGDDDAVTLASRTPNHTHTGPSHTHTVDGHTHAIGAEAPATGNTVNDGEANSHHTGHILRDTGAESLCTDADLTFGDTDVAPSLAACVSAGGDAFTKLQHNHIVASHSHGGATGSASPGTSAAGTGATGAKSPGHIIYRRAVFAGV